MPFPFGKSHKSPADIVKNLKDSMNVLEKHDISDKKAEKVGGILFHLITLLEAESEFEVALKYYNVYVCLYDSGHRGGVKKPGGHEGDPLWD